MEAINWHSVFFLLTALVTCGFAVAVVFSGNIVRMACYLVLSLSAVSALFFLAGAQFVGVVQLLVYVGGTMVLLVFGVMLTARRPFVAIQTGAGHWLMATVIGLALLALLWQAAMSVDRWRQSGDVVELAVDAPVSTELGLGLLGVRVDQLQQEDATLRGGMSGYLLPFEIVSVHLLVVLVGAAFLARARRRETSVESIGSQKTTPELKVPNP